MSVNASHASLAPVSCFTFSGTVLILTAFCVTNIVLVLPLSVLVLCLGLRRWRRRRSSTAAMNHSDAFTYQMAAMELIGLLGCSLVCAGVGINIERMVASGLSTFFSTWSVKIHFHTLTCAERYLAVVHPVTYVGLKASGRIRIRNVCTRCLWLLIFVQGLSVNQALSSINLDIHFIFMVFALIAICFYCISVLRSLRRPRPGEAGRGQEDQMKQRAFVTVATIMAALWLCLGGMLLCIVLAQSQTLSDSDGCAVRAAATWFSLPSSLVLPLLYLHRAGKLPGCK